MASKYYAVAISHRYIEIRRGKQPKKQESKAVIPVSSEGAKALEQYYGVTPPKPYNLNVVTFTGGKVVATVRMSMFNIIMPAEYRVKYGHAKEVPASALGYFLKRAAQIEGA